MDVTVVGRVRQVKYDEKGDKSALLIGEENGDVRLGFPGKLQQIAWDAKVTVTGVFKPFTRQDRSMYLTALAGQYTIEVMKG